MDKATSVMQLWLVLLLPVGAPFSCSDCHIFEYTPEGQETQTLQTTGDCSVYTLVPSDLTECEQADEICAYRYQLIEMADGNITEVKRQCTTYNSLGLTSSDVTVDGCLIGSDSHTAIETHLSDIEAYGFSESDFQSYFEAYYCVFDNQTGYVPEMCDNGEILTDCDVMDATTEENSLATRHLPQTVTVLLVWLAARIIIRG